MRKIKTNRDFEAWLDKKINHTNNKLQAWKVISGKQDWMTKRVQVELDGLIETRQKISA